MCFYKCQELCMCVSYTWLHITHFMGTWLFITIKDSSIKASFRPLCLGYLSFDVMSQVWSLHVSCWWNKITMVKKIILQLFWQMLRYDCRWIVMIIFALQISMSLKTHWWLKCITTVCALSIFLHPCTSYILSPPLLKTLLKSRWWWQWDFWGPLPNILRISGREHPCSTT